MRHAVGNRGIDGVFGNVAFDPQIVVARGFARQRPALLLHLVRRLPRAGDDFADAAHGLRIRTHHADGTEVVQDIFGSDGLAANAALGEGDILRQLPVEVVAEHYHVEMLVDRIDGVGARRVGGTG